MSVATLRVWAETLRLRVGPRSRRRPGDTGAQARQQRSLFGEILDWMLAPLLVLWPMSVVLTWLVAQGIANHPFDRELAARARALAQDVARERGTDLQAAGRPFAVPASTAELLRDSELVFQVRGPHGELRAGDPALPLPPDDDPATPGEMHFRDARLGDTPVRVASLWVGGQAREAPLAEAPLVQVAETFDGRSRLAGEIVKGVLLPQFVVLPLAVLLVWLALARGIASLSDLQQRIRRRDSDDLSPIDEQLAPDEVAPLVRAINDLLTRLDRSMRSQKNFLADAAHQLKTPLAGLRTQAEFAGRQIDAGHHDPQALKKTLQQIARSSERAAHMVNQLLAMARAENRAQLVLRERVEVARLATETVQDFVPRALAKRIDLGYEGPAGVDGAGAPAGAWVLGHAVLLGELIRNLVDNALHYTPSGGTVTVRVADDKAAGTVVLQVEDSGPGIAAAERERVFEPFYRSLGTEVDGSGLGLAIVREIARQHRAEVAIDDAGNGAAAPGTLVTVRLPAHTGSGADPEPRSLPVTGDR